MRDQVREATEFTVKTFPFMQAGSEQNVCTEKCHNVTFVSEGHCLEWTARAEQVTGYVATAIIQVREDGGGKQGGGGRLGYIPKVESAGYINRLEMEMRERRVKINTEFPGVAIQSR